MLALIDRARRNGVHLGWLTFDAGYGMHSEFMHALEERGVMYVGEVPGHLTGWTKPPPVMLKEHASVRRKNENGEVIGRPRVFPRPKVLPGDMHKAKSVAMNLLSVGFLAVGGWGGLLASLGAEALYVGTIFGYSRDLEEEADHIGLAALDAAGYDVAQTPASFKRLLVDYEGLHLDTPIFYSSPPSCWLRT